MYLTKELEQLVSVLLVNVCLLHGKIETCTQNIFLGRLSLCLLSEAAMVAKKPRSGGGISGFSRQSRVSTNCPS